MKILTPEDFTTDFSFFNKTTRRVFIKGIGLVSAALLLSSLGGCDKVSEEIRNRPTRRHLRIGSPEVDADIATYRQAVALMKSLPAGDPRSWAAEAGIHGTFEGFNFCEHGTDHFFDWHRVYLYFFEKICQKLTGNAQFGLPYWNWNQTPDIHPAFLDTSSTLFLARNRSSMTGSSAVTTAELDPIFADTNFFTFRQQLEGTPHNTVHGFIGGTMGSGASALDPLFWMHHCMVDYCWVKWNEELGNNNPNESSWTNFDNSHFVDANSQPAHIIAGLSPLLPLLFYQYESSAIGSSPAMKARRTKAEFQAVEKRIREGADIRFDIKQRVRIAERIVVSIAKPLTLDTRFRPRGFAQILNSNSARERIFASIEYAKLPITSDFSVRVFVNLPTADSNTSSEDPHYAGSFAFFGSEVTSTASTASEHKHQSKFLVDLTSTIQRLTRSQMLKEGDPISVQLVPSPFAEGFEKADTELQLNSIDIITTPVLVNSSPR